MSKSTKSSSGKRGSSEQPQTKPAGGGFSPKSLLNMFLERWWIGLIVAAAVAAAFVLSQPKPEPIYKTEVKLLFENQKDNVIGMAGVVETTTNSGMQLQLHIEQMLSRTFYESVQSSFTPKEIEQIQNAYRNPDSPTAPPPSLADIIRPNVRIEPQRSTTILRIMVWNKDPEAAALIANRFARQYIQYTIDRAMTKTSSAMLLLRGQAEEKRTELQLIERQKQDFRAKHNMAALGENKGVVQQKVTMLGNSLAEAELRQTNLRTLIESVEDYQKNNKNILEISDIASYGNVSEMKTRIDTLRAERRQLDERYLSEHPRMKQNQLAMEDAEAGFKSAVDLAIAELKNRFNFAKQHELRLRTDYAETEKQAQELDKITSEYKYIEDESNIKSKNYQDILSRLSEISIISQLDNVNITIHDKALVPGFPDTGTPKEVIKQAAALAFVLFFGIPVGLGFLDTRVKSSHDVESGLNQTLLGGIKAMKKLSETERPNVFRLGKDEALSEAYRGVFSEVEIRSIVPYPKRILFTSSIPSEGKSLTASNMAAVFAAHGKKTLLVDCDFRRPTLRRYFGTQSGVGLLPWLRENGSNAAAQVETQKMGIVTIAPGLDLLPAGDAIKNPTEVIDQLAHCDLFNKLSKIYDLVIIDTPPAAVFPDALLLSRFCTEMIYVCRFKTVRKAVIRKALEKFQESGITILGVVLNCMPHASVMNYGYDGYGAYKADYYKSYQGEKAESK
ncbi:sugar tyrosine-protein kinase [Nibricoccus aquaticus]|uniref:Sugar tyrosine-protein kinase n=1 Tax=Nibricoccus aquaticus TaxID=2576891 RepID=A0A290QD69_9BACT|nr:polysaccharide biosynthesis tyrosine autokinase [Nibricoccus aquaticus]ATC63278.1 sugar tyrosine-protein kinase [Nibricoccus aquaticus]